MADKQECKVCRKMTAEKYKHLKVWRILAIVFMCLTILFAVLYFATGEVFTETVNDVEIVNTGGSNNNSNNVVINN